MKILHTSDWHLGHTLYDYDRTEEQTAMWQQVVEIVRSEQPDAFLLSGDVYDTMRPSDAVQKMFVSSMMALRAAAPAMTIVVTAGNHDSKSLHDVTADVWEACGVHVVSYVDRRDLTQTADDLVTHALQHLLFTAPSGYILAVPFERHLPSDFFLATLRRVAEQNTRRLPVVVMAHTMVVGSDAVSHTRLNDSIVGGVDAVDLATFGTDYDYLALGHIHKAQTLRQAHPMARYSGTPLAVSFDETFDHSVSLVEIAQAGAIPLLREIPITPSRPLVTLPAQGAADYDTARHLLADFPDPSTAYIRLNVRVNGMLPPRAEQEIADIVRHKQCRFCLIHTVREAETQADLVTFSVQEFREERPLDVARRYLHDIGEEFTPDMEMMMQEVIQDLEAR